MATQDNDTLYVIAAAYEDVDAAVADYEAVKALYREVRSSHDFDAAVIAKDDEGKVHIVKKHEQPTLLGGALHRKEGGGKPPHRKNAGPPPPPGRGGRARRGPARGCCRCPVPAD